MPSFGNVQTVYTKNWENMPELNFEVNGKWQVEAVYTLTSLCILTHCMMSSSN